MNNHQKVTICLKNGKFQPCGTLKIENLNPKALLLCSAAECAGFTVMNLLSKSNIMPKIIKMIPIVEVYILFFIAQNPTLFIKAKL